MKISRATLIRGVSWTVGAYGIGQLFRFSSNVVLSRVLSPELFGLIAIIHSVRMGIDLISDVGIGQSVVLTKHSDEPAFYNTAWTLQLIRGIALWCISLIAAVPLAHFYEAPILAYVLPVASLPFIFVGLSSIGGYLALKRMQFIRLNVFDLGLEFIAASVNIAVALVSPTIWALISGLVVSNFSRMCGSYFLVPNIRHKIYISKKDLRQITGVSKWILLSSIVFFLSANFDSLYIGKAGSLALLGVYGIARALAQQIVNLVARLSSTFVFPIFASSNEMPRDELWQQVKRTRCVFLLATAVGFSLIAVGGDLLVAVLYDQRYSAAGWMLPILMAGAWFSSLCSVNESILLGLSKPSYGAVANCLKFMWLLIGVPVGFAKYGVAGAVIAVAVSDFVRYFPVYIGQLRERISFGVQDLLVTIAAIAMMAVWEFIRIGMGFGVTAG
jgi:O-antigen/teichoic acid export membrane protein